MAVNRRTRKNVAYGLDNPLQGLAPEPIVAQRAPTANDTAPVGTLWIVEPSNAYYVLTSSGTWTTASASGSSVASLTVTGGAGDVLVVDAGGDTDLGGDLAVAGDATFAQNVTVTGDFVANGDFDLTSASAISFTSTANLAPSILFETNGGTTETLELYANQGTALDSIDIHSDVGGIRIEAAGLASTDAINLLAGAGGVTVDAVLTSAINVVGAAQDIQLNATGGSIAITATEATAGAVTITASDAAGTLLLSGVGGATLSSTNTALGITSGTGALSISADAAATTVNVATGAGAKTTTLGSTNTTSSTTVQSGSGVLNITATGGALTVNSGTGALGISTDASATAVSIATGGAAKTVVIGNATGATSVDITAGTGGITVISGAGTSITDTGGAGVDTDITNTAGSVNISAGEATTDAITLSAGAGGIDITASGAGGAGDIDITTASQLTLTSTENSAQAIYLRENGGTSGGLRLHADQGTSVSSVALDSDVGGISLTAGLASTDAINLSATAGGVDIDGALEVNITSSEAAVADAVTISASAADGGITLDSGATPGVTFTNGTQSHQMLVGTGSPNGVITASQGSLYVDVAGATSTTILFCNTDGGTTWVGVGA